MPENNSILDFLEREAFDYFLLRANPENGLVPDTSREGSPASIAVVGFALSSYPAAVERGWITRDEAVKRTLATMRFFYNGPKGKTFKAIGHRGFCYHFLDMKTGRRAWECEISFIDTALLLAGMFTAATYFSKKTKEEASIRLLVDKFYRRIEWDWALNKGDTLALAWSPGKGFKKQRWKGYNEGLILYLFALASPTHSLEAKDYHVWASSYKWEDLEGIECLYAGPLFIHHFSHAWIDFRGISDHFMCRHNCDYFENSRRASMIHRRYAAENKWGFKGYNKDCWGLSAGEGPAGKKITTAKNKKVDGLGYAARGAPFGPDDGTLSPAALIASLPFIPKRVLTAIRYIQQHYPNVIKNYHVPGGFNPSLVGKDGRIWICDAFFGLDHGIILLMIENYRTGLIWSLMRRDPYIKKGLKLAGFRGGWLDKCRNYPIC